MGHWEKESRPRLSHKSTVHRKAACVKWGSNRATLPQLHHIITQVDLTSGKEEKNMAPPQKKARTGGPKSWLAILNAPAFEDIAPPPSCKDESDLSKKKTGSCGPGVRRVRFDEQAPRAIMHASLDRINRRALWYSVSSWATHSAVFILYLLHVVCIDDQCFHHLASLYTNFVTASPLDLLVPNPTNPSNYHFRAPS